MVIFDVNIENVLVFAAGGGGDVVTAAVIADKLNKYGYRTYISTIVWERYTIDPHPGPISISEIINSKKIGLYTVEVNEGSYAIRNGKKIIFQAVNVSSVIKKPIYICEISAGSEGLYRSLDELIMHLNIDLVLGVDVGGDVLAVGKEEELWSPLADQISLAALYKIYQNRSIPCYIAISSIGSDGELPRNYIIDRLSKIAREGGLIDIFGFGRSDEKIIKNILSKTVTEAGTALLDAIQGYRGWKIIRDGTRKIYIDILSTIVFILDVKVLFKNSPMATLLFNTKNIHEANDILVKNGIFTELELEKEIFKMINKNIFPDSKLIIKIKKDFTTKCKC